MDEKRNLAAFKNPYPVDDEVKTVGAYNAHSLARRRGFLRATPSGYWRFFVRQGGFRFPMPSKKFFIDIILPASLWPWG